MKIKRADILLIGAALAVSVGLLLFLRACAPNGAVAVISIGGLEYTRLSLDEDTEITVGDTHKVIVSNRQICVIDAPCPDQICVRHAPIERSGESIVCLPYRLVVTVEEGSSHE